MKFLIIVSIISLTGTASGTDFGVVSENQIAEGNETSLGTALPVPVAASPTESTRDAVKLSDGTLVVYNGTFDPVLSVYANQQWADLSFDGWSTVNNGTYGGIASDDRYVWVTDMDTGTGTDEFSGIIKFDLQGTEPDMRFALDIDPIDLTLGEDGLLYALYPGGSPGGRFINVYNPNDSSLITTINLVDDQLILGDRVGNIFIADTELNSVQEYAIEDLNNQFTGRGVFILGNSASTTVDDLIFADDFDGL